MSASQVSIILGFKMVICVAEFTGQEKNSYLFNKIICILV